MSESQVEESTLVDLVEKFPHLWNNKDPKHKDKVAVENAWESISVILECSTAECEQMWTSIRLKYIRERRKMKNIPSGSGAVTVKWDLFERLGFPDEAISTRRTKGNISKRVAERPTNLWQSDVEKMFMESEDDPQTPSSEINEESLTQSPLGSPEIDDTPSTCKSRKVDELRIDRNKKMGRGKDKKVNGGEVDKLIQSCTTLGDKIASAMKQDYDEDQLFGLSVGESIKKVKKQKIQMKLKAKIMNLIADEGFDSE